MTKQELRDQAYNKFFATIKPAMVEKETKVRPALDVFAEIETQAHIVLEQELADIRRMKGKE